jgi:hypothetical protein
VNAEDYTTKRMELDGWPIVIESYHVGDRFFCTISNADPGARFARAEASSAEEAERTALEKARRYLAQTRVRKA